MHEPRETILYQEIASRVQARINCIESKNTEWLEKHEEMIRKLVKDFMPSGCGIDSGTKIDLAKSHAEKLVFSFGYHHMNSAGYYDGWTQHTAIVTPSFNGLNIRITGRNRNDAKDHLHETVDYALQTRIIWDSNSEQYRRAS